MHFLSKSIRAIEYTKQARSTLEISNNFYTEFVLIPGDSSVLLLRVSLLSGEENDYSSSSWKYLSIEYICQFLIN